jgi:hypothetical protein
MSTVHDLSAQRLDGRDGGGSQRFAAARRPEDLRGAIEEALPAPREA